MTDKDCSTLILACGPDCVVNGANRHTFVFIKRYACKRCHGCLIFKNISKMKMILHLSLINFGFVEGYNHQRSKGRGGRPYSENLFNEDTTKVFASFIIIL